MNIHSYSKQELALLYFPGSDPSTALKRLRRWINRIPALQESLCLGNPGKNAKFWTRHQVELIIEYLDEP